MRRILKKFSFVITTFISFSIVFTKNVFADIALPSEYSERDDFKGYIIIAIILAIIIGILFIFIVKENRNKKNVKENNEEYNNDDIETINLVNNLTNSNKDSQNE